MLFNDFVFLDKHQVSCHMTLHYIFPFVRGVGERGVVWVVLLAGQCRSHREESKVNDLPSVCTMCKYLFCSQVPI